MSYHIDTGLIKDATKADCECPLCEIQSLVENQIIHEFLNDAAMDDDMRTRFVHTGICDRHYDMMFAGHNKLSLALQIESRIAVMLDEFDSNISKTKSAKKEHERLEEDMSGCIICKFLKDSMDKYTKAFAEVYAKDAKFRQDLAKGKGFCMKHYSRLLKFSASAGSYAKEYLTTISNLQKKNFERIRQDLKVFCAKHDYRNREMPWGTAEDILPRTRIKLFGKKPL